ncbi:MAG: hypothetical protein OSB43_11205 [Nocardioides sp.]|uniref:serine O-acetyltransferase n=1 Tax=Nocardioides sp. TaxID=35761 RepID=UPI00238E73F8|nr:hypothetical protein [Nocardioides sp.]MDE0776832.1 hypothetical protein [Nocardioides sp.]
MSAPNFNTRLIYLLRTPVIGWFAHKLLRLQGVQINPRVQFGKGVILGRGAMGTVIDKETVIGDRVKVYHQVTLGRAHPDVKDRSGVERVVLEDDVLIAAGAKVLCAEGQTLTVGRGTWVAANAVLTRSTGEYEVWGGIPAKRISNRDSIA